MSVHSICLPMRCVFLAFFIKNSPFFALEKFKEGNLTKLFPMLTVSPLFKMSDSCIEWLLQE